MSPKGRPADAARRAAHAYGRQTVTTMCGCMVDSGANDTTASARPWFAATVPAVHGKPAAATGAASIAVRPARRAPSGVTAPPLGLGLPTSWSACPSAARAIQPSGAGTAGANVPVAPRLAVSSKPDGVADGQRQDGRARDGGPLGLGSKGRGFGQTR